MKLSAFPLVKVGLCFIAGIVFGSCFEWPYLYFLFGFILSYIIAAAYQRKINFLIYMPPFLLYFSVISLGGFLYTIKSNEVKSFYLEEKRVTICGTLSTTPEVKEYFILAKLMMTKKSNWKEQNMPQNGEILLKFSLDDSLSKKLRKGDFIEIQGLPKEMRTTTNPGMFDSRQFYFRKGIVQQMHIDLNCWKVLVNRQNKFWRQTELIKDRFLQMINRQIKGENEKAIVKALLLGYRTSMPDEVFSAFSKSGTIHVLAVSGLHVGAVMFLFGWLLDRLKAGKTYHFVFKPLLLILLGIAYSFLTGLSPSVIRSVVMFSTILIGKLWFRNHNTYNILIICSIWMLIFNPFYIHDLSFQFSFLSLAGILLFHPYVKKWITPKPKVLQYAWELTSVSLCAQTLVFPFSIYYFHQFPTYFVLSSLVAIPVAVGLVYGGIFFFIAESIGGVTSEVFALIYEKCVSFLWAVVSLVEGLPMASIDMLYFDDIDVILLTIFFIAVYFYVSAKKVVFLYGMTMLLLLTFIKAGIQNFYHERQEKLVIYEVMKGSLFEHYKGKTAFVKKSKMLSSETESFISKKNRLKHGINQIVYLGDSVTVSQEDFKYEDGSGISNHVVWTSGGTSPEMIENPIVTDYVLISKDNSFLDCKKIKLSPAGKVVLSMDLTKAQKKYWKECLGNNRVPYVDIGINGYTEFVF